MEKSASPKRQALSSSLFSFFSDHELLQPAGTAGRSSPSPRVSARGLREGRLPTARVPSSRVCPGLSAPRVSSSTAGLCSAVRSATATAAAAEQRTELHGRMVGSFDFDVFVSCSLKVFSSLFAGSGYRWRRRRVIWIGFVFRVRDLIGIH
ncbi:hypothetical protein IHE45_19G110500 [Dioscorea alata]|uniref:Uncharacterized protein n=1 Tax=Dioscorea alata TaxID=55571 RepID=A0ACB7U0U2_DIOAL|nr:hypothetical protein IHE45_19G110500 [Dioscorea alata]